MNSKEIILYLMKEQNKTNGWLAHKVDATPAALWDRFYGKNKDKDVTIPLFLKMLSALDYKLVVVPRNAKVQAGEFLVTTYTRKDSDKSNPPTEKLTDELKPKRSRSKKVNDDFSNVE